MDKKEVDKFNVFEVRDFPLVRKIMNATFDSPLLFLEGRNSVDSEWYSFPRWNEDVKFHNFNDDLESGYVSVANNIWFYGSQKRSTEQVSPIISKPPFSRAFESWIGEDPSNELDFGVRYVKNKNIYVLIKEADLSCLAKHLSRVHRTKFKWNIGM